MGTNSLKEKEIENGSLEDHIVKIVEKAVKERLIEIASNDIKVIAKELMPDIDKIISKKIKEHLKEIGNFLKKM